MATHPSILAQRIPQTEETDGLQSMGSQRVEHNGTINTQGNHPHLMGKDTELREVK